MWLDLVVLAILAAAAAVGALRGTVISAVRLAGAAGAYAGAWLGTPLAAPLLAPWLEARLGLSGALVWAAAGLGLFAGLLLAMEGVTAAARALERRARGGAARGRADRLGGAAVSVAAGLVFAVLVGWLAVAVDALRTQTGDVRLPSTERSVVAPRVRAVVRSAAGWALADQGPAGAAAARAVADPADALARVERLVANPHLQGLRDDPVFWEHVEAGRPGRAADRTRFLALAYDGATRRELAALGVVDAEAAASSRAFREAATRAMASLGPRLRALRRDPAMQRLARDPAVRDLVAANDTLGLLRHPDVRRVLARALSSPAAPPRTATR